MTDAAIICKQFQDYLANNLNECVQSLAMGDDKLGDNWETPDVIGIFKKRPENPIDFSPEIVSAEIKTDRSHLINGFYNACTYRLFSHKIYLVGPGYDGIAPEQYTSLEALCHLHGMGLVYFDRDKDPKKPEFFSTKLWAQRYSPDQSYMSRVIKDVETKLE